MAAAFYIERDFPVVADDDGPYVQAMRGNGCNGNRFAVGNDDRTADAQGVSRRPGGSGYDQAVGLIGCEMRSVDGSMDAYHGRTVAFQHCYFIKGVWRRH